MSTPHAPSPESPATVGQDPAPDQSRQTPEAPQEAPPEGPAPSEDGQAARGTKAASQGDAAEDGGAGPDTAWSGRRRLVTVLAGILTVVLGGFGVWATVQARGLRSQADSNRAVIDAAATASVRRQIGAAVRTVFSYSYTDTAQTRAAAQRVLTGPAIAEYNRLFALVERQAPQEKLVVTTTVTNIGVEMMTSSRARLLVFADQQDVRAGTRQASYAGAMFAVTAVLQHGTWKIENIDTFTGG